jgi:hypothetical protein
MEEQSYVCTLLRRACILCMFKKFKFNDCTSSKIVWRRCYHATRKDVLKPRTNLGVWLKQIQCKSCSAIAKLTT